MLFDQTNVFVGTMNFDPRSVYLNTELGLIVNSRQLTAEVRKVFERLTSLDASLRLSLSEQGDLLWRTREEGREVVHEYMPNASLWDRFKANLMELLLPNSWL